jgi:hypothetical protein
MKNVVECPREFLAYFNALETYIVAVLTGVYYVSIFLDFSDSPTHYVSINTVLNVSKNDHFPTPPTHPFADVI